MKDTGPHSVPLSKPFCFVGGFKVATKIAETSKMAEHQCQHVFLFFKYCFALLYLMWPGWTCKVSNCISSFRADGTAATVVYANILSERFRKVEATLVDGQRNQRFWHAPFSKSGKICVSQLEIKKHCSLSAYGSMFQLIFIGNVSEDVVKLRNFLLVGSTWRTPSTGLRIQLFEFTALQVARDILQNNFQATWLVCTIVFLSCVCTSPDYFN